MLGRTVTKDSSNYDEWRRHISEGKKGLKLSEECKKNISKALRKYDYCYETLHFLYWNLGMSLADIANIYDVYPSLVHHWFIVCNVPRRERLSFEHVAVNLSPSTDLIYILGVIFGDGNVKRKEHRVQLGVKSENFAQEFYEALKRIGFRPRLKQINYWTTLPKGERFFAKQFRVYASSKEFHNWFLNLAFNDFRHLILEKTEFQRAFIKGFYESEGSVRKCAGLNIYNTNKELIDMVKEILEVLDFNPTLNGPYTVKGLEKYKPFYCLYIRKSEREQFLETIKPCIKKGV